MRRLLAILFLATSLSPGLARSDILPPEGSECQTKNRGDACTGPRGGDGTCQDATCTDHDHRIWTDAGVQEYATTACLKCLDDHGNVPTDNVGCSLAPSTPSARELAALLVAGGFSALFILKRRRRAK